MKLMKFLACLIGLALVTVFTGCGQSKLETENSDLKNQISNSESENKQLKMEIETLKQQTNQNAELESELKSELDNYKQEIKALKEKNSEDIKQMEVSKIQIINTDIDKILARMNRVMDEAGDDTHQRQLANSVKVEIQDIVVELESSGFTNTDRLKNATDDFFSQHSATLKLAEMGRNYTDGSDSDNMILTNIIASTQKTLNSMYDDINTVSNLTVISK